MTIFKNEQKNKQLGIEALKSDAEYLGGYGTNRMWTKDKVLKNQGLNIEDLTDLEYDNQVSATMQLRKDNVKKLLWEINKGMDDTAISDFVKSNFEMWNIQQLIDHFLSAIGYGYSVSEKYFIPKGDRLILHSIQPKPAHWFFWDTSGSLRFKSVNGESGRRLTKDKFVVVQNGATEDNPYGIARLSRCWTPVTFKRGVYQYWMRYISKYGVPVIIGRGDTSTEHLAEKLQNAVDSIMEGNNVSLDIDDVIEVINPGGNNGQLFLQTIEHFDKMISKAILSHASVADTIPGQLGNNDNAIDSIEALMLSDKMLVETAFNNIIRHLVKINFGDVGEKNMPVFEMYEPFTLNLSDADKDRIGILLQEVEQGLRSKESVQQILSIVYDMEKEQFEALLKPVIGGSIKAPAPQAFSEKEDTLTEYAAKVFQKTMQPLVDMIVEGKDYEEIEEALQRFMPDADTEELQEVMTSLMIQADAYGQSGIDEDE